MPDTCWATTYLVGLLLPACRVLQDPLGPPRWVAHRRQCPSNAVSLTSPGAAHTGDVSIPVPRASIKTSRIGSF